MSIENIWSLGSITERGVTFNTPHSGQCDTIDSRVSIYGDTFIIVIPLQTEYLLGKYALGCH